MFNFFHVYSIKKLILTLQSLLTSTIIFYFIINNTYPNLYSQKKKHQKWF